MTLQHDSPTPSPEPSAATLKPSSAATLKPSSTMASNPSVAAMSNTASPEAAGKPSVMAVLATEQEYIPKAPSAPVTAAPAKPEASDGRAMSGNVSPPPQGTEQALHERLNLLEKLVAQDPGFRQSYQQALGQPLPGGEGLVPGGASASLPPGMVSQPGVPQDMLYQQQVDATHDQVTELFDKGLPGLKGLMGLPTKDLRHQVFLNQLEQTFQQELMNRYHPGLWFSPWVHQDLVGKLMPLAQDLARALGLMGADGRLQAALSPVSSGQTHAQHGGGSTGRFVEPSSPAPRETVSAFDKAYKAKDTLGMVKALFKK